MSVGGDDSSIDSTSDGASAVDASWVLFVSCQHLVRRLLFA